MKKLIVFLLLLIAIITAYILLRPDPMIGDAILIQETRANEKGTGKGFVIVPYIRNADADLFMNVMLDWDNDTQYTWASREWVLTNVTVKPVEGESRKIPIEFPLNRSGSITSVNILLTSEQLTTTGEPQIVETKVKRVEHGFAN